MIWRSASRSPEYAKDIEKAGFKGECRLQRSPGPGVRGWQLHMHGLHLYRPLLGCVLKPIHALLQGRAGTHVLPPLPRGRPGG